MKNCVILPDVIVDTDVHLENIVVDKHAKITHVKEVVADPNEPGYIKRNDVI